jgi:hypothetical protein
LTEDATGGGRAAAIELLVGGIVLAMFGFVIVVTYARFDN